MLSLTEGVCHIPVADIVRLEARSNYTLFYFMNRKPLLSACVLHKYEHQLLPHGFIRTHRSHLVNKQHIIHTNEAVKLLFTRTGLAVISRRRKNQVFASLTGIIQIG